MAIILSKHADGNRAVVTPECAGEVVANHYEFDITGVALAANDIIDLGILPAYCTVVDAILISDDLDTNGAPTLACDVGVMSGEIGSKDVARTCGNELFAASNVGQAGGVARPTKKEAFRIASAGIDRSIGLKITTAAATQAAAGKISLLLFVKQ